MNPQISSKKPVSGEAQRLDAVIVGAGFAGMYMLHRLRSLGLSALVIEAAPSVGGTWYWNCYPGARCDVESVQYSYSFSDELQQEWNWTERYARQPEILRYLNHVADRFELRRDIRLNTRVTRAAFDEADARWCVTTAAGDRYDARFCIMATGALSEPKWPELPGLERFEGRRHHTARWPREGVDFAGQRVGVIGTGSTGIQSIPVIAAQAAKLFVFQRTPNFSIPARNAPLADEDVAWVKRHYAEVRDGARQSPGGIWKRQRPLHTALGLTAEERQKGFDAAWANGGAGFQTTYIDLLTNPAANRTAADYVHARIREAVRDPAVADALCPTDHPLGAKRLCVDSDYYATFNREHVTLVDLKKSPIREITPHGVRTADGEIELDALVCATGFDALTGALSAIDIQGRGGASLTGRWADGPRTYLGLAVAGFPNLFIVAGPGSPSVLSNVVVSIEQHVDWLTDCIAHLRERGLRTIEATASAQDAWVAHVNEVADTTVYPLANSWYVGANVPGKPRVFMPYVGGVNAYRARCDEVAANGYRGFTLGE